jgi:hypothetical protein
MRLKIQMLEETDEEGKTKLIGHIKEIKHVEQ